MHYDVIQYEWADRILGPHTSGHYCKWEISHTTKWPPKTGQRHTLQQPHIFNSDTISQKSTYLRTLTSPCILCFLSYIYWIPYSFTLSLTHLNTNVKNVSFTAHASILTHALANLSMLGLRKSPLLHLLTFHGISYFQWLDIIFVRK